MTAPAQEGLQVISVRTRIFLSGDAIIAFLMESLPANLIQEGSIIAITSKLISIAERGFAPKEKQLDTHQEKAEKKALVEKEADLFLGETIHSVQLTIKHGLLLPSAGIDESNSENGEFILYPKDPYASAKKIGLALRAHFGIQKLGVILTDSHSTPLRSGVTGIGLSHFGFKATRNLIGQKDLFGREIKATQVNVLDALAVAAVFEMGESNDARPLAILNGARDLEFTEESDPSEIQIPLHHDLYFHALKAPQKPSKN